MRTLIIEANDIRSNTISCIYDEIEKIIKKQGLDFCSDVIDAAANHIFYTDEDFVIEY